MHHKLTLRLFFICNILFVVLLSASASLYFLLPKEQLEASPEPQPIQKRPLPKNPFAADYEALQKIEKGPLALKWTIPVMELPDLRDEIIFYGKNGRVDLGPDKTFKQISLKSSGDLKSVETKEKVYLVYTNGAFNFSAGNKITPLWLEVSGHGDNDIEVQVGAYDSTQTLIKQPTAHSRFIVTGQEFLRSGIPTFEIAGFKVDTTLLIRQRARWVGTDLFLAMHGGDEYVHTIGRERLDFSDEQQNTYSLFVKTGDTLVWKAGRWQEAKETVGLPMMVVKRIDDRVMTFDIWDPEGKGRLTLSLIRQKDNAPLPDIATQFKFVGAKTWAQFIVECNSKRMILKTGDWLLLTEKGWQRLVSSADIDDYVSFKNQGPLLVLEKLNKLNGKHTISGHLFNAARTEVQEVELQATASPFPNLYTKTAELPPPIKESPEAKAVKKP